MNTKYGKLISRERDGTLTAVYPEIIIDDEVDFANRNSTFPVTNIGIANAIDNAVDTAKNSIQYAFTSEDGGLGWNENTQRGYVDFSNIPASKVEEIALAIVKPNSAISIDSSSGKIDVDFSKLKPSDIVPLCDSGGGIVADTTNGKLRISFQNMNADGFSKLGVLPVANGGTGQTTVANIQAGKDGAGNTITATYVTLATAQNITGAKTFSTKPVLNQVGLDMTVKDTNSATTRTAQILHANSDNAGYGINLGVGGSGNTVLGAGESCTAQLNELAGNASENLYLVADGNIYFKPNGNTWSNVKTVTLNSAGEMSGLSKVTATEFVGNLTGTFNGPCIGNADSATKLQTARTINGTSFDGSGNITTSSWGTARNIYISDSDGTNTGAAVSVNGSGNATLKLPATIKASITGNASGSSTSCTGNSATATKLATARSLWGNNFDGSAAITGTISGTPSIEFKPSSNTSNNGGYLDFHYNQSTADYTSRIIESESGTLNINNVTITTGKVVTATTFNGALTGNVTGNCSGSSGSCTGNAATATKVGKNLVIKLKSGTTEGTDLYTYNGSGAKTLDIKQGTNVTLTAASGALTIAANNTFFASGTRMLFQQSSAPSGWTKETESGYNNAALRLVTGNVANKTNGKVFTTCMAAARESTSVAQGGTVGDSTLSYDQGVSHSHSIWSTFGDVHRYDIGLPVELSGEQGGSQGHVWTDGGGGSSWSHSHSFTGQAHTHKVDLDINYIDCIVAKYG